MGFFELGSCNGICMKYKTRGNPIKGKYRIGQKRCQICSLYLIWEGLRCPCCNYILRTKPRNSKFKLEIKQII